MQIVGRLVALIVVILCIVAIVALIAAPARSAPACIPRAELAAHLADRYGERPAVMALTDNGSVLEMFANRETGSFTLVLSGPGGLSCLLVAGHAFQLVPAPAAPGKGA